MNSMHLDEIRENQIDISLDFTHITVFLSQTLLEILKEKSTYTGHCLLKKIFDIRINLLSVLSRMSFSY